MMKRLFVTGVPVTGNDFAGRKQELRAIRHFLQNGQSVVVIAPRRFGKTSLILTILQELQKSGSYVADVDLFTILNKKRLAEAIVEKTLENKKIESIVSRIKKGVSQVVKNIEMKQVIEDYQLVLKFAEPHVSLDDLLEAALDFPQKFAEKEKRDIYFFYDEFGDVAKLDGDDLIKLMRGKFQRHSNVCYIFAGSHESLMNELFTKRKSAFYKFARIIYLEEIASPDFADYIRKRFKQEGIGMSDEAIKGIIGKTRCHPYYTQLLCGFIHYIIAGKKKKVEQGDIEDGYEEAFISEKTYLEKLWEELTVGQLETLFRITSSESLYSNETRTNVGRSVKSLLFKGIIKRTGRGKYGIIDPFFEEFLRRNR
ncbi:MAG: hypothetical protein SRB1_02458 [Desulfobacteraceae bacterium Eth-SRB1]|nr:MAG: hypothetical protein SRB1_02458 [Desulfobacteraceae bacterium Eth-SRB1]